MQIGLFFGSFNPIHNGHLIIANSILQRAKLQEIWFVVSPQNPFKKSTSLLPIHDRLHLVNVAIEDNPKFRASDIELSLPKPSYTIDTLTHLREKFPQHTFSLILGGDNLETIHKWKNADILLRDYTFYVYNRNAQNNPFPDNKNIHFFEFPLLDVSSTFLRNELKANRSVQYFVPQKVWEYIDNYNLYKKKS